MKLWNYDFWSVSDHFTTLRSKGLNDNHSEVANSCMNLFLQFFPVNIAKGLPVSQTTKNQGVASEIYKVDWSYKPCKWNVFNLYHTTWKLKYLVHSTISGSISIDLILVSLLLALKI